MLFEIMTTLVVLSIFSVFYYYAHKAEKVVAAKAQAKLAQQQNALANEASHSKKAAKKGNQSKTRVIV